MWLGLGIVSLLLFFNLIWPSAQWASLVAIVLFSLACNVTEAVCFNMFLMAFTGVGLNFVVGIIACLISILARYIIDLIKKRKKAYELPLIISFLIILVYSFVNVWFSVDGFIVGMMIIYVIVLAYLVFVYHKEIDIQKSFNFMLLGLVVSIVMVFFSNVVFRKDVAISTFDGTDHRLQLLSLHMNYLSMYSAFELAYSIYSIINKKRKLWIDVVAIILSLVLGILTLSKAFLLLAVLMAIYVIVVLMVKLKKKAIVPISIICVVGVVAIIIGWPFVKSILDRFLVSHTDGSLLSRITTGRIEIWEYYMSRWAKSPKTIFFGVGLFTPEADYKGLHNVFLHLVYRFGVVGVFVIAGLVASYFKSSERKLKINLNNCLLFVVWLLYSLEEVVLNDKFALFLFLGIILMLKESCQTNKEHDKMKTEKDVSETADGELHSDSKLKTTQKDNFKTKDLK